MLRLHNFILKQLTDFKVSVGIFTKIKCAQSLHLGNSYWKNEPHTLSSMLTNHLVDKQLNFRIVNDVYKKLNFQNITNEEIDLLLRCCGSTAFNSSLQDRNKVCQNIYGNLIKHNKLDLNIYNKYIQICTENRTLLNYKVFLQNLNCDPDNQMYKLLFQNACECGDISQAFFLLEKMKIENVPIDENIFTNLVFVHTLKGGIEAAENVLETMKIAQILETSNIHLSILKGVVRSKNYAGFKKVLEKYTINLDENEILNILKDVGLNQTVNWLSEMNHLFFQLEITKDFINNLKNICTHLVHMGQPESAIKIFNYFKKEPEENYGFFILEEMLHSNLDSNEIISAVQYLYNNNLNEYAFEKTLEVALRNKSFDLSWKLLEHLRNLKPHFFWPFFLNAKTTEGEAGIFKVMDLMINMKVPLDSDTLEHYIIPYCNHDDFKYFVEKLKKTGVMVKSVVGPLIRVLLKKKKVQKAAEICEHYNVHIGGDKLFQLICLSWINTKNPLVVTILKKYCGFTSLEDDMVGEFLISSLSSCKSTKDFQDFLMVLKHVRDANLKLTTTSADALRETIQKADTGKKLCEQILDGIDQILAFKLKAEKNFIPHPRYMSLEELECHLVELQEKGMETRGILRKLIQMYVNLGNTQKVEELRKQFVETGYEESSGMKSSLMYNYIKSNDAESALNILNELKMNNPTFSIDQYKLIDLATLLVKNDRVSEATTILSNEISEVKGPAWLQRNCVQLLNAFKNEEEQTQMFNLLVKNGLCKINNIMLGPLIRISISRGDLERATMNFTKFAETYNHTPLQFELIREVAQSRNEELLQKILDITTKIRGPVATQVVLIGALAEINEENILRKLFASTQIPIKDELRKRCERWIKEGKVNALLTLAKSCDRSSNELIDIDYIYECIIKAFEINNDCAGAVRFYENLLEKEVHVDPRLEKELHTFLQQNNYSVPSSIRIHNEV